VARAVAGLVLVWVIVVVSDGSVTVVTCIGLRRRGGGVRVCVEVVCVVAPVLGCSLGTVAGG
jgi:hypothetical protein